MDEFTFLGKCTSLDADELTKMYWNSHQIKYNTARKLIRGLSVWCRRLGYSRGMPLRRAAEVQYYRSTYRGEDCVYLKWSSYDYVWVRPAG